MTPTENPTTSAPLILTKTQLALLKKAGPFRVHAVVVSGPNPRGKGKRLGLVLKDPAMQGVLHEVAEALLKAKSDSGEDFVIEDPRTTQILWTSVGVQEGK